MKDMVMKGTESENILWHVEHIEKTALGTDKSVSDWSTLEESILHMGRMMRYDLKMYEVPDDKSQQTIEKFLDSTHKVSSAPEYVIETDEVSIRCTSKKELVKKIYNDGEIKVRKPKKIFWKSIRNPKKKKAFHCRIETLTEKSEFFS